MQIKVGDIVTWRHGKSKSKSTVPLGIAGCEVLEFGTAHDGAQAVRLKLPSYFDELIRNNPTACNAYVADLELERSLPDVYRTGAAA